MTLLAASEIGYRNLMKLASRAYLEGYYYKPRMDSELLAEHSRGDHRHLGLPGRPGGAAPRPRCIARRRA